MFDGTLAGWTEQDGIDEMMEQREAMGRIDTTGSDRLQICLTASMMFVCWHADDTFKSLLDMHYNEMYQRMAMIQKMNLGIPI